MFTLTDMPVKFIGLLILFSWTTVWCVYELSRRQDRNQVISNAMHLVMSVVMLAMVAKTIWVPFTAVVPVPVWIAFFALTVVWFAVLAVQAIRTRRPGTASVAPHYIGHGLMMAAMTWHLSAMQVKMMHMGPGMRQWMMGANEPGGAMWVVALIGLPLMTYLLGASLWELSKTLRPAPSAAPACPTDHSSSVKVAHRPVLEVAGCHEPRPIGSPSYRMAGLAGFAMNFGMFWMSTGLMVALLPFMKYLSF